MIKNNLPSVSLELITEYKEAKPFPHIIIDNLLDEDLLKQALQSIKQIPHHLWKQEDHREQVFKRWIQSPALLPSPAKDILTWMNSEEMIGFISTLSDIPALIPDHQYNGGGLHNVLPGGHLGIHYDFNYLPGTRYRRKINALLYMNAGWQDDWGGFLELWNEKECLVKIKPQFNRLVIFNTDETSYHGHPDKVKCPDGISRLAFAMYAYAEEKVEDLKPFHWSIWPDKFKGK